MTEEKKRSANFTVREEALLVSLVKQYANVLECKRSDTKTNQEKVECWKLIEKKFNSVRGEYYRHDTVLRNKYENLKKRSKTRASQFEGISGLHRTNIAISNRICRWAQAKKATECSRKESVVRQDEFKLKAMMEKHQLEMDILKQKAEDEANYRRIEHEARMEAIYLQAI